MSASNYLEDKVLDYVFSGAAFSSPATVYISLHTADPVETGTNEVSGNAYARVAVTNNATNWPAASTPGGVKANGIAINWPTPTPAGWGTVTHFGIWDAATTGNFLVGGALGTSKTINAGDTVSAAISALTITMD